MGGGSWSLCQIELSLPGVVGHSGYPVGHSLSDRSDGDEPTHSGASPMQHISDRSLYLVNYTLTPPVFVLHIDQ